MRAGQYKNDKRDTEPSKKGFSNGIWACLRPSEDLAVAALAHPGLQAISIDGVSDGEGEGKGEMRCRHRVRPI